MEIIDSFKQLLRPSSDEIDTFHALLLPGYEDVRIAIDYQGRPGLLILDIPAFPLCNFRLKYLEVSVRHGCQIKLDGKTNVADFVILLFKSTDEILIKYFFSIINIFLTTLKNAESVYQKEQAYQSLLEIFRSLNDEPLSTVQGLWSELFIINESDNIQVMVDAWHNSPNDRFDFTLGGDRLEVKSSKVLSRVHTFAAFQLIPEAGGTTIIASVFAIESPVGTTLQELNDLINSRLDNPNLRLKMERIIARTLGRSITQSMQTRFDATLAKSSLCYYNAAEVPRIEANDIPYRVSDVHFKSDLSAIIPINPSEQYVSSDLFRFI